MSYYLETSMAAVFLNRVVKYGDAGCVAYKDNSGKYVDISWKEMEEKMRNLSMFLIKRGIEKLDTVAIFSPNRYEWWLTDLACLAINAIDVPVYPTNSAAEAKYILENSDTKICFVATKDHLERILEVKESLPRLELIVTFDETEDPGVITFSEALAEGAAAEDSPVLEERLKGTSPLDPATIIYTSGTTGNPKGVLLSNNNLMINALQSVNVGGKYWRFVSNALSFLPLSHGYERVVGYYMSIYQGQKVYFAEGFDKILKNFQEVRPALIVCVPRLLEKIHAGVLAKVAEAPDSRQKLFYWAMDVARRNLPYICTEKPRKGIFALEYFLADRLVFSKLKKALGLDRLVIAISGGGPLSVSDAEFFLGMGIRVLEGFGITEASPCTNSNTPEWIKPGTCGRPILYTEQKFADDGEILVRGPQVMLGYYKDEAATREIFTDDGYLRTGDLGRFDEDGFLVITGRKKDIIITAGGKNVSPQNIENALKASNYIEQVAVIGDNRKYLSVLVVPAFDELCNWAKNNGIDKTPKELVSDPAVGELIESEIEKSTKDFARVEKIKRFCILDEEWSQETGELTPTLKVKRRVINEKYSIQIEEMYL